MPERVRITDVSPRDGLQNEPGVIPTPEKAKLVELLCATGVDEVEVTSFVSSKWVPQLGDAKDLISFIAAFIQAGRAPHLPSVLSALVPNVTGFQKLREAEHSNVLDMEILVPPLINKIALF